jgi:hypothetical protein
MMCIWLWLQFTLQSSSCSCARLSPWLGLSSVMFEAASHSQFRYKRAFAVRKPPLEAAVAATGGLYQSTGLYQLTGPDTSIEMPIDQIAGELNAQYMLSYRRSGGDTPGFHQIKVEVVGRRSLKVRSRPGYYLLP